MKKILILLLFLLVNAAAFAYRFKVDGIGYSVISADKHEVEVSIVDSLKTHVIIPQTIEYDNINYTVKKIGMLALSKNKVQRIDIPNTIVEIGYGAFQNCILLTAVDLPNSITSIGDYAFEGCRSLASIGFGSNIESIGDFAFRGTAIKNIKMPNSLKEVGSHAFSYCSSLQSISFSDSLLIVPDHVCDGCWNLVDVKLGEATKIIGAYAFTGCHNLLRISVPMNVTKIDEQFAYQGPHTIELHSSNPPTIGFCTFFEKTIIVPKENIKAYKKTYKSIIKNQKIKILKAGY